MTARLTRKEAAAIGLTLPEGRTTKTTARGPYRTKCHACAEVFTTAASEDRHHAATGHVRYDLELSP
jgi:hypothetical protein